MIKLKPGQIVILEDGSRAKIEEGDCLKEKTNIKQSDFDRYILSNMRIQTKPIFQAYEIYANWASSLGYEVYDVDMIGSDVEDISSYESWGERIIDDFLSSILTSPRVKIWDKEFRNFSKEEIEIAKQNLRNLMMDKSYREKVNFFFSLSKNKPSFENLLKILLNV